MKKEKYTVTISIFNDRPYDIEAATLEQAHNIVMDACLNANDEYCIRCNDDIVEDSNS